MKTGSGPREREAGAWCGAGSAPRASRRCLDVLHRRDLLFQLFDAKLDVLGRNRLLRLLFGSLGPGLLVVLAHDSARFREGRGWTVDLLAGTLEDLGRRDAGLELLHRQLHSLGVLAGRIANGGLLLWGEI